jgi:hypothetical protein
MGNAAPALLKSMTSLRNLKILTLRVKTITNAATMAPLLKKVPASMVLLLPKIANASLKQEHKPVFSTTA